MKRQHNVIYAISSLLTISCVCYSGQEKIEEETVHTLGKHPEYVNQIPLALTYINKNDIDAFHADTLSNLEDTIPSLNFGRGERRTRGEITIRGVGDFSRNIGSNARVAVYIDGVPAGRSSAFDQGLDDIASIEILRGPQSTLYGANTISGTLYLSTIKPSFENKYSVQTEAGNHDFRKNKFSINHQVSDTAVIQAGYAVTDQNGFIDNILLNKELQTLHRETGFAKALLEMDEKKLTFNARFLKESGDSTNAVALEGAAFDSAPDPRQVAHDADEFEDRELRSASITYEQDLSQSLGFSYQFGILENEFSEQNEEDYSALFVATSFLQETGKQHSHELRLIGGQDKALVYVAGLFYMDQEASTRRRANAGPFFPNPNTSAQTPGSVDTTTMSLYGNASYAITPKLSATGGLRYLVEEKEIVHSSIDTTGVFINVDNLKRDRRENKLIPSVSLTYEIAKSADLYTSVSKGFKSGGWNADLISSLENFEFDSEAATSIETGIKALNLGDGTFDLNLVFFHTKFDNFQVFQIVPTTEGGTILSLTNAGEVTTKGLELDTKLKLDPITLVMNIAYTDATFDSFRDGGGIGVHYDGNDLPYAPEISYYLGIHHKTKLGQATVVTNLGYAYADEHFSHPNNLNENTIDSRYTVDFSSKLSMKNWEFSLWVENLTDELNLKHKTVSFLGQPRGFYEAPRTYGLSIRHSGNY